jgi:hypothetical protein
VTTSAPTARHLPPRHQTAEASELGLAPGEWPETLGDGYFHRSTCLRRNGEIIHVRYVSRTGASTLIVFND